MRHSSVLSGLPTGAKPGYVKTGQKRPRNTLGSAWFSYKEEVLVNKNEQKRARDNVRLPSKEIRCCGLPTRLKTKCQKKTTTGKSAINTGIVIFIGLHTRAKSDFKKKNQQKCAEFHLHLERTKRLPQKGVFRPWNTAGLV